MYRSFYYQVLVACGHMMISWQLTTVGARANQVDYIRMPSNPFQHLYFTE